MFGFFYKKSALNKLFRTKNTPRYHLMSRGDRALNPHEFVWAFRVTVENRHSLRQIAMSLRLKGDVRQI